MSLLSFFQFSLNENWKGGIKVNENQKQHPDNREHENKLQLTILVDGFPVEVEFPAVLKVEEVIKKLLQPGEKQNWGAYQLSDRERALNPDLSLQQNAVPNGATLSLTKSDGGGGNLDRR